METQFREWVSSHKDYVCLQLQEMIDDKDDWFEAIDEVGFTQKHKIYNWIKEVVDDNKSRYSKSLSKKS